MKFPQCPASALLLALAFVAAPCAAPPVRAQDEPATPATPATPAKGDAAEVRARWNKLSPDERRHVQENYERWKKLPGEEKDRLRQRHARLDEARRVTNDDLPDEERSRIDKLRDDERRRELTVRTKKALKERYERLPPDLRRGVEELRRDAPPREREARIRKYLQGQVPDRIGKTLIRRVDRGQLQLPREDIEALSKQMKETPRRERAHVIREFVLAHPETFRLPPELRKRLSEHKAGDDPLLDLRLLEQIDRQRTKPQQPAPGRQRKGNSR